MNTATKRLKLVSGLVLLAACSAPAYAVDNPWDTRLPVKEMTIEYTLSGMEKGSQTTYVRDYGKEVATWKKSTVGVFGMGQKMETLSLRTPKWQYEIDLREKTGNKTGNMNRYLAEEFDKLSRSDQKKVAANVRKMGISMIQGMGGNVKPRKEKFLGFDCDVVSAMGATTWTIANSDIVLKSEANIMGLKNTVTATGVKKGHVPADRFEVPKAITVQHDKAMDDAMRDHAKRLMQWFKDPEGKPMPMPAIPIGAMQGSSQGSAAAPTSPKAANDSPVPPDLGEALKGLGALFGK